MDFYLKHITPNQWNLFCDAVGFPAILVLRDTYRGHFEFSLAGRADHYYTEDQLKAAMIRAKELIKLESLIERMRK